MTLIPLLPGYEAVARRPSRASAAATARVSLRAAGASAEQGAGCREPEGARAPAPPRPARYLCFPPARETGQRLCRRAGGRRRGASANVRHLYICDFHKNFIQSVRNKRKRKTSDDGGDSPEHETDVPEVDLFQLQVNTLRRYKRHYKLQTRPGLNKAQLAETVSRHFRNIPVNEKETLAYFIYMVKNNKSRLDQKSEGSKQLE
uniref:SAP30 like n=45 Tax=Aves TaxID=8782 RepID=A0A8B9QEB3_APTOW